MDTHVFNEKEKRFDPIDTSVCMCCGHTIASGRNDNFIAHLYKENDRTDLLVYRNVKFSRIDVGVARCKDCRNECVKAKMKSFGIGVAIFVGLLLVSAFIGIYLVDILLGHDTIGAIITIIGIVLSFIFSFSKAGDFCVKFLAKKSILSEENAARQYGIVEALLADGWTFEKPTA